MLIFIGNLPADAPLIKIQQFLGNHEMCCDFSSHIHKDRANCHFILIKTNSDESADELIRQLNGKPFHDAKIQARRWVKRQQQQNWEGPERRVQQLDLDLG